MSRGWLCLGANSFLSFPRCLGFQNGYWLYFTDAVIGYQFLQMDSGQICWLGAEDWVLSTGLGDMRLWQREVQNMLGAKAEMRESTEAHPVSAED